MRARLALVAVVAAGLAVVAPGAGAGDLCGRFEPVELGGTITEPRVLELSGLARSPGHSDVLWGHNDSGGAPELYAMAEDGTSLGAYPVAGAEALDWEDLASGPGPNGSAYLYVGDIGDNAAQRESVTVYRVAEPGEAPVAPGAPLTEVEAIELTYPDGPADAEALLIDPRTGDLTIVTKSLAGRSHLLTAPADALVAGPPVELTDAGTIAIPLPPTPGGPFPATLVTAGDVSPDGSIVLLRTYQSVLAYPRGDDQTVAEALLGEPCFAPQEEEPQGEAIAFTGDGAAYVFASEGVNVPVHRVGLAAPATTTTEAPSTSTARVDVDDDVRNTASSPLPVVAIVAAGIVALVVGAALVAAGRRRRRSSVAG